MYIYGGIQSPMAAERIVTASSSAAHKAIRANFKELSRTVTEGDIPEALYAKEIITDDTLEFVSNQSKSGREKGRKVMLQVQKGVKVNSAIFDTFCGVLADESLYMVAQELSRKLRKDYESNRKEEELKSRTEITAISQLKDRLEGYTKELATPDAPEGALHECIKHLVRQHFETALKSGEDKDVVTKQLNSLCYQDLLIPSALRRPWATQLVDEICDSLPTAECTQSLNPLQPTETVQPPLFSKDTLYHSSICCQAVSTCTAENLQAFLRSRVSGHLFEEVSMSTSEGSVSTYLIAKQDNTLYVAFRSEATLSSWMKKHPTFDEGLKMQSNPIPLRFFVEQLWDRKRIVLTGFSFGGLLACYMAAVLWETSYIAPHVLQKNMVCITYGQPLISVKLIQDVIQKFKGFETSIHSMFDAEDVVPRLLGYLGVECLQSYSSRKAVKAILPSVEGKATTPSETTMGFRGPFISTLLQNLAVLQDAAYKSPTYSGAVSNQNSPAKFSLGSLKCTLGEILASVRVEPASSPILGTSYMMSSGSDHNPAWNQLTNPRAAQLLGLLDKSALERLETNPFKQHIMDDYRRNMLTRYIEKEPLKYVTPIEVSKEVKAVGLLQPKLKGIEFYEYPNEHAVVLEGDNLWFCHEVVLGKRKNTCKITTPAQSITRHSIQFNFTPTDKSKNIVGDDGKVVVTLHSHFYDLIGQVIKVKQEPYSFSLRQIQLAKQTPSEIIQLAYWSAMFERYSNEQPNAVMSCTPSERFKEVARFLEEAVKVVPIESIFYAIAYASHDTALKCAEAVTACQPRIPSSLMMLTALERAVFRMRSGAPAQIIDQMMAEAIQRMKATLPLVSSLVDVRNVTGNRLEVVVRSIPRLPVVSAPTVKYSDITRHHPSSKLRQGTPPRDTARRHKSPPPAVAVTIPAIEITTSIQRNPEQLPSPSQGAVTYLVQLLERVRSQVEVALTNGRDPDVLCNQNIEQVYPVSSRRQSLHLTTLQSPLEILKKSREELASFVQDALAQENLRPDQIEAEGTEASNELMLELVRGIREHDLKICEALLGSFMEQQIHIPLLKSPMGTAKALSSQTAPVAVGVWALFSRSRSELREVLSQLEGNPLNVEIADYIAGIFKEKLPHIRDRRYAAKLQFLLQGIQRTVSCSSQYISYSLEHQLCSNLKFDKSISVKKLVERWDTIFKDDALSFVAESHRSLIARWLKWAILVHDLRETLAKYTCVGVAGLINSGKSQLVNVLFRVQALVGTTDVKRTTVPFMYNLDGVIDGLDVIDFPGVDDKDHSVPGLAQLLVRLAQVVIFVVDYRKFSNTAKAWIHALETEDIPVLVCLTHADRLYVECTSKEGCHEPTQSRREIRRQLEVRQKELGHHPSRTMEFYCLYKPPDSSLTHEMLKEAGIGSPQDVGDWLVETFKSKLNQQELATKLYDFIHTKEQ